MPIQYSRGVLAEHRHVREAAGLFDVSHMGQILLTPRLGDYEPMARALEALLPLDVISLLINRQRYGLLTNGAGGIIDDLMVANLGPCLYLVVNAASAASDLSYLQERMSKHCDVKLLSDRALLALQGPEAVGALGRLVPSVVAMDFMEAGIYSVSGVECFITRSGYTGEDGFEISVPVTFAQSLVEKLLQDPGVQLVGLAARDSLRLEAGLCLYGHDLTLDTTPVEAGLAWAISPIRRAERPRAGGFPGAEVVLSQLQNGPARMRVGLVGAGRPVRKGAQLFAASDSTHCIGRVTSGTYSPTLEKPIALGYVPAECATAGSVLFAEVRGDRLPLAVTSLPFVPHRYRRTPVK